MGQWWEVDFEIILICVVLFVVWRPEQHFMSLNAFHWREVEGRYYS